MFESPDGDRRLRPFALVGTGWAPHDAVVRERDGTLCYGLYAQMIVDGASLNAISANLAEAEDYSGPPVAEDLAALPEIPLTLPEPTPEEAREHALWRALDNAVAALTHTFVTGTDARTRLTVAKQVIDRVLSA